MDNLIEQKSEAFAIRIIKLYKYLSGEKNEFVLAKQILKSGTSIGANICEAENGQSKRDFISKLSIALKEAEETKYWLKLLYKTDYLSENAYNSINEDCVELVKLLTSIVKSTKKSNPSPEATP